MKIETKSKKLPNTLKKQKFIFFLWIKSVAELEDRRIKKIERVFVWHKYLSEKCIKTFSWKLTLLKAPHKLKDQFGTKHSQKTWRLPSLTWLDVENFLAELSDDCTAYGFQRDGRAARSSLEGIAAGCGSGPDCWDVAAAVEVLLEALTGHWTMLSLPHTAIQSHGCSKAVL